MSQVFNPQQIHEVSKKAIGLPQADMARVLGEELHAIWPGHVETREDWMFNLVAGLTGVMTIFHGSLTEYVLLYGTPIGSVGYSGRYRLDIWDAVIAGEMDTFTIDSFHTLAHFEAGDLAYLPKGVGKGVRMSPGCWMLEYGRGPVPTALPVGVGDAVFSAFDPVTVGKTVWAYGRHVTRSLLRGKI
jgi:C-8 sterol isomerase